jgi:threonine/homoserine/homoserine lactone efflux protein
MMRNPGREARPGMVQIPEILHAILIGFLSGFVISIPVGPINVTIINEGAHRGFRWAALIGLGAITMDFIYCSFAFAGLSGLFASKLMRATIELLSFLVLIYLGLKYLFLRELPAMTKSVERVEHRLHPHTAFMIGFVRILGNPAVLLFWMTLSATFISHEWIEDTWTTKAACVVGMSGGVLSWFLFLAFVVSLGHGRFSTKTLVRMSHISGGVLLLMALVIAGRLVKVLAHH